MNQPSNEYIRDLQPETMRYDVSLESDFVISVLPNGIKTWAFLYEYQGRQRRKTLGVYPEMSQDEASTALQNARAMIERLGGELDSPTEEAPNTIAGPADAAVVKTMPEGKRPAVLASGYRPYPRKKPRPDRPWGKYALYAAGVVATVALLVALGMLIRKGRDEPVRPAAAATPARREAPRTNPFAASAVNQDTDNADDVPAAQPGKDVDARPPAAAESTAGSDTSTTTGAAASPPDVSDGPDTDRIEVSDATRAAGPDPAPAENAPDRDSDRPSDSASEARSGGAVDSTAVSAPETPTAATRSAAPAAAQDQAVATPVRDETQSGADDMPVNAGDSRVTPPAGATSIGGSVPRAIVTSGVSELEPIDNLNDSVVEGQGRFRSLFFFTELRSFSDGDVVHRWEYNGRVIADVPLKVRKSWRWRTYSSKDLLPGMTGDWAVSVVDANGNVLARSEFRFED